MAFGPGAVVLVDPVVAEACTAVVVVLVVALFPVAHAAAPRATSAIAAAVPARPRLEDRSGAPERRGA